MPPDREPNTAAMFVALLLVSVAVLVLIAATLLVLGWW